MAVSSEVVVECPHGTCRPIDELGKLLVLISHSDRLIGWDLIQVIDILEEV